MFWTKDDSVVSLANRMKTFYTKDCNIFIHHGKNLKFDDELLYWKYDEETGEKEGKYESSYYAWCDMFTKAHEIYSKIYYVNDESYEWYIAPYGNGYHYTGDIELLRRFKDFYPEKTVREVFTMLGYDMSKYSEDTVFFACSGDWEETGYVSTLDKVFDEYETVVFGNHSNWPYQDYTNTIIGLQLQQTQS